MKIKENLINEFLSKPNDEVNLFIFTGPDYGLTNQRFNKLLKKLDVDKYNPFNYSQLKQDDIEKSPTKLVDESLTVSFDKNFRVIVLKLYGESFSLNVQNSIKNLLTFFPINSSKIIISAQNIPLSSSLIKKIIDNPFSALIVSYNKTQDNIKNYLKSYFITNNIEISDDALHLLSLNLGDDQKNLMNKIESILSFIYPNKNVSYNDVADNLVDSRLVEIDDLVFSIFSGNTVQTLRNIDHSLSSGTGAIEILRIVINWAIKLKAACEIYRNTKSLDKAVQGSTNFIFWKVKARFEDSIKLCTRINLDKVIDRLLQLEKNIKIQPSIDKTLVSYSLLGVSELINKHD